MSNKNLSIIIVGVAVILLAAGFIYWRLQKTSDADQLQEEQQAIQNIKENLEAATQVEIPSANPLDAVLSDVNPVERVNPFRTKNPFE